VEYQIIDSDNYQEAGVHVFTFPGGEPHVKFNKPLQPNGLLFLKLRTWHDVGYASVVLDAIAGENGSNGWKAFIPYYPGARQDRRTTPYSPETVKLTYSLLHSHFLSTWTFDPHSAVLTNMEPRHFMPWELTSLKSVCDSKSRVVGIIAPDKGAVVRAKQFHDTFYPWADLIQCEKVRDPDTGFLTKYNLPRLTMTGGRYIIVDDICDGGATFNSLANEFKVYGPDYKLELFVSHGIFSKGIANLDPVIEHITTTDSFTTINSLGNINNDRLTVVPLQPLFDKIMGG
jgi:ribose-phosphate pyrophosphokinase